MTHYVTYDPNRHAGQALFFIEAAPEPDGGIVLTVRKVITAAEFALAQLSPSAYVVADPNPLSREARDIARGLRPATRE